MNSESLKAAGWTAMEVDGFSGEVGPLWLKGKGAEREVGFLSGPHHTNGYLGTVHGGALMTFADVALGIGVAGVLGGPYCATAQLQLQFVAAAKIGEFITCKPEIIRQTSQIIFVRGLLCAAEKIVASADGLWKVMDHKRP
jgi:acyl-coenzyme A thioesterase PaaI-like protein